MILEFAVICLDYDSWVAKKEVMMICHRKIDTIILPKRRRQFLYLLDYSSTVDVVEVSSSPSVESIYTKLHFFQTAIYLVSKAIKK